MTFRGAAIQGGLALAALGLAYATWQRQPERTPGEVVVLDLSRHQVAKVRLEDGAKWVELEPRGDEVWLRLAARPEAKTPERRLRGSESASRLLERFAPLRASRALGVLAGDKLKEFGLDAPKKKLSVAGRGTTFTFFVGNSPFGVSDPYVKDERDGRVYVLAGSLLSDFEAAGGRLVERTLHGFTAGDYDGMTIAAGDKTRELVAGGGTGTVAAKLFAKQTPDKPDALAKNWHDKLWRIVPVEVLGEGETPAGGAPAVALKVTYTMRGKTLGWIELARVQPAPPAPAASASVPPLAAKAPEVYLRSEHTAGWVKVPASAEELIKEADKVVAQ